MQGFVPATLRSLLVLRHPWGGWERTAGAANPERMCHCPARDAPLAAPGRSDGSAVPGPAPTSQARHPGRKRGRTPLTMLAGEGDGSGELALGLRTRPARTVQVMVPAGSGSPPPMQREPLPYPGPRRDPLKRVWSPGPPHRGPPEQFIKTHPPLPKETEKKQEMGLGSRQGGQRLGAPCPGPTPEGKLRAQAGSPRPPRSEAAARAQPRSKRAGG